MRSTIFKTMQRGLLKSQKPAALNALVTGCFAKQLTEIGKVNASIRQLEQDIVSNTKVLTDLGPEIEELKSEAESAEQKLSKLKQELADKKKYKEQLEYNKQFSSQDRTSSGSFQDYNFEGTKQTRLERLKHSHEYLKGKANLSTYLETNFPDDLEKPARIQKMREELSRCEEEIASRDSAPPVMPTRDSSTELKKQSAEEALPTYVKLKGETEQLLKKEENIDASYNFVAQFFRNILRYLEWIDDPKITIAATIVHLEGIIYQLQREVAQYTKILSLRVEPAAPAEPTFALEDLKDFLQNSIEIAEIEDDLADTEDNLAQCTREINGLDFDVALKSRELEELKTSRRLAEDQEADTELLLKGLEAEKALQLKAKEKLVEKHAQDRRDILFIMKGAAALTDEYQIAGDPSEISADEHEQNEQKKSI